MSNFLLLHWIGAISKYGYVSKTTFLTEVGTLFTGGLQRNENVDDLTALVTRAQADNDRAYEELVRRFQDMAYGYAYAILNDFHLAEDAAQEAFIEAYRCLAELEHPQAFPAWFKRIVFKHCDRLTRGKRVPTMALDVAEEVAAHTPGPDEMVEQRDLQAQVLSAIRTLPDEQRTVITLYYIREYSQDEIAAFLDVPPSTVKSRLHASRKGLKERMMDMVRDALKSNALPESFTEETLAKAVAQAGELNKQHQYDEAEILLRDVLGKAPSHVGALKELNRAVMRGGVYGEERWDRLPELVEHGQTILASGSDDEYVYHEMARTLLALPTMPEAIEFIEGWIAQKGSQPDRMGMLAWAKGCVAEYEQAETHWNALLTLTRSAEPQEVMEVVLQAAEALVDCFASAQEIQRARHIAQSAWQRCRDLDAVSRQYRDQPYKRADNKWLKLFHQAGLPVEDMAQMLLARLELGPEHSIEDQGVVFSIRAWTGDTQGLIPDWLTWVQTCIDRNAWHLIEHFRNPVGMAFRTTGQTDMLIQWSQVTWELLETVPGKEAETLRSHWNWMRFHVWDYLEAGDLSTAEALTYRAIEELGFPDHAHFLIDIATLRGGPTPPELTHLASEKGIEAIDSYGKWGWYFVAREAAVAGDNTKAFDALRRALNYWSNPPLMDVKAWENDAYWGDLREHPEYMRIFAEKRQRIGPVYGQLWYFPGW